MAITFDWDLGTGTGGSGTTVSFVTLKAVTAGAKVFLCVQGAAGGVTVSITTAGGLTWTQDQLYQNDGENMAVFTADAPAGLALGTTLGATFGGTVNPCSICGFSVLGLAAQGSCVDVFASGRTQFNTTSWNANGVVTTNANDLVIGFAHTGGAGTPTSTPGSGYTEVHDFAVGGGSAITTMYQIVSSTNTYTPNGTWSSSQSGADQHMVAGSYKQTGSTAPINTVAPAVTGIAGSGHTLSCSTGSWTNDTSSGFTYQWQRDTARNGSFTTNLGTAATHLVVAGDVGNAVRCVVTATGTGGATAANSNAVNTGQAYGPFARTVELQADVEVEWGFATLVLVPDSPQVLTLTPDSPI